MPVKTGLKYVTNPKETRSPEKQVLQYEAEPLHKGQIVFYGPSNFTRWSAKWGMVPLRDCILGASGNPCVVNRGFGSSNAELQLYYYPRMIRPLEPKVLVYYPWGNQYDYSDEETWEIAQRVIAYTFTDFPDVHVYLQGANPRRDMTPENIEHNMRKNAWAKEFAQNTPNCYYLNAADYAPLRNPDLFVKDGIHFNQDGYRVYEAFYKEALKDELARF